MDEIAQAANASRSQRGGDFERRIEEVLKAMQAAGEITSFERSPNIYDKEFNPDFIVIKLSGEIVSIDSTTTARTDRLRGKQWDAYGTKLFYKTEHNKEIAAVVVIDEHNSTETESNNFRRCKARTELPHSMLDAVVSVDELVELLKN